MADVDYVELKNEVDKNSGLDYEITLKVSASEMGIIEKKATALGMEAGELMRVYVLKTPVFDGSVFGKKRAKIMQVASIKEGGAV